jgi:proteasome lid subunit RPN8/RPN11/DNA-directed RNA polymerase subunit RPC12/RpoP
MTGGEYYKSWRIPQCPFEIECSAATLDRIRREVESGLSFSSGPREAGGVLYGKNEPGRIRIVACRPLDCEHALGPGFVLSETDEKRLADLIAAPGVEPDLHGLDVLGWYHSHVYSKIFLSERDAQIHARYFSAPFQVALVLQPRDEKPPRAGFFFREADGAMRTDSCYEEIVIEGGQPKPQVEAPGPAPSPSARRVSPHRKPSAQAQPVCPRCGSKHIQKSRRTDPLERFRSMLGYYPYRCQECLSRFFLRQSPGGNPRKRPEERRRAWLRTRREILLYAGAIFGFLLFLLFLMRETSPKTDQP